MFACRLCFPGETTTENLKPYLSLVPLCYHRGARVSTRGVIHTGTCSRMSPGTGAIPRGSKPFGLGKSPCSRALHFSRYPLLTHSHNVVNGSVNPSTLRPKCRSLLGVDTERRLSFDRLRMVSEVEPGAVERVKGPRPLKNKKEEASSPLRAELKITIYPSVPTSCDPPRCSMIFANSPQPCRLLMLGGIFSSLKYTSHFIQ